MGREFNIPWECLNLRVCFSRWKVLIFSSSFLKNRRKGKRIIKEKSQKARLTQVGTIDLPGRGPLPASHLEHPGALQVFKRAIGRGVGRAWPDLQQGGQEEGEAGCQARHGTAHDGEQERQREREKRRARRVPTSLLSRLHPAGSLSPEQQGSARPALACHV